jgi:hypothetical protein
VTALTGADFEAEIKMMSGLSYDGMEERPPLLESDSFYPKDNQPTYEVEFFTEEESQSDEETDTFSQFGGLSRDQGFKARMLHEPPDTTFKLTSEREQEGSFAIAEFDFAGEQDGDLNIRKGELIQVLSKDESGWWYGRIGTRTGNFPSNFVHSVS